MTETKKSIKNGNNKNKRTGKRTASKKTAARKTTAAGSRRISDSKKRISSKRRAEKKKRMFQIGGLVAGVVLVILLCSYVGLSASVNKVPEDKICDNVFIGTVEVSGMKELLGDKNEYGIIVNAIFNECDIKLGEFTHIKSY